MGRKIQGFKVKVSALPHLPLSLTQSLKLEFIYYAEINYLFILNFYVGNNIASEIL